MRTSNEMQPGDACVCGEVAQVYTCAECGETGTGMMCDHEGSPWVFDAAGRVLCVECEPVPTAVTLILPAGRSTEGVLRDALAYLGHPREVTVVTVRGPRDGADVGTANVAEGVAAMRQRRWDSRVVLVANGGTTAQAAPLLLAAGALPHVTVIDVQRDGVTVLRSG